MFVCISYIFLLLHHLIYLYFLLYPPSKKTDPHLYISRGRGLNKSSEILKATLRQYRGNIRASYISI